MFMEGTNVREPIGFIGLGKLGLPLAENLLKSGYPLAVHNRTASKAASLVQRGARLAKRPADAVACGGVVVTMLWDHRATEEVVTSPGFLDQLGPRGVHVGLCTGSPEGARRLAALHADHGSVFVEATVLGRPEAAVARQLWMPVAGPAAAKERVHPLLLAMGAQGVFDFGEEVGAATVVKLAANFLILSAACSLAEALTVVDQAGVNTEEVADMLTQTLFSAPIYRNYGQMIVQKKTLFGQSDIPRKDLGSFQAVAQQARRETPVAQTMAKLLGEHRP